jgi:hypothetical protein
MCCHCVNTWGSDTCCDVHGDTVFFSLQGWFKRTSTCHLCFSMPDLLSSCQLCNNSGVSSSLQMQNGISRQSSTDPVHTLFINHALLLQHFSFIYKRPPQTFNAVEAINAFPRWTAMATSRETSYTISCGHQPDGNSWTHAQRTEQTQQLSHQNHQKTQQQTGKAQRGRQQRGRDTTWRTCGARLAAQWRDA